MMSARPPRHSANSGAGRNTRVCRRKKTRTRPVRRSNSPARFCFQSTDLPAAASDTAAAADTEAVDTTAETRRRAPFRNSSRISHCLGWPIRSSGRSCLTLLYRTMQRRTASYLPLLDVGSLPPTGACQHGKCWITRKVGVGIRQHASEKRRPAIRKHRLAVTARRTQARSTPQLIRLRSVPHIAGVVLLVLCNSNWKVFGS
jgi:hypothetical protein